MKMQWEKIRGVRSIVGFGLVAAVGCGGTGSFEDVGSVSMAIMAGPAASENIDDPANQGAVTMKDRDTTFELVRSQVYLRDIELDLPDRMLCSDIDESLLAGGARCGSDSSSDDSPDLFDDDEDKIRIDGPIIVDLVTGETTPDLTNVRVPALPYRRIDFRVDDGDPDDGLIPAGHALDDRSWVTNATFEYGGESLELDMEFDFGEDLRVEQSGGITLEDGEEIMVLFDADLWLSGVSIAGCLDNGELSSSGGRVVINKDSECDDVEDRVRDNLKNSARLDRR